MLERNKKLLEEQEKLEKGRFKGQTINHWVDGVVKIIDFPRKPTRKELFNGKEKEVQIV
jgi:hypothetical protein